MNWLIQLFGLTLLTMLLALAMGIGYTKEYKKEKLDRSMILAVLAIGAIAGLISNLAIIAGNGVFIIALYASISIGLLVGLLLSFMLNENSKLGEHGIKVVVLIVVLVYLMVGVGAYGSLHVAKTFDNSLTYKNGNQLFANDSLPYSNIPIVSYQYADYVASSHIGDFGGNTQIYDHDLIVYNNTPYWIFSVGSTNTFKIDHLFGFILVNAVNANFKEIKESFDVGAGLFWGNNINFKTYYNNSGLTLGNHYPQYVGNNTVYYIQLHNQFLPDGNQIQGGGYAYNAQGQVVASWTSPANAPKWVSQPWDKNLYSMMVNQWAINRNGNHSFGFFADGAWIFKAPSSYVLSVDNNTELIPYHDGTAYMEFVSPRNAPNALSGVILISGNHRYYYNMQGMNLISAVAAKATIQSKLQALSGATYFTANPVLYPVGNYYAWIVPYYSQESTSKIVQLQGIGIVDAENSAHFISLQSQFATMSSTGVSTLIHNAVGKFLGQAIAPQPNSPLTYVNGTVQKELSFDQNGSTVVAVEINNSFYYGSASYLNNSQMVELLQSVNESVSLQVQGNEIQNIRV